MSEELEKELKEKFLGYEIPKSIYRVKGRKMIRYAKSIGATDPKYVGTPEQEEEGDYSSIIAHPAFAATYTIDMLMKITNVKTPEGDKLLKNIGKLLHTGQSYDYEGCVPVKHKMKIYTYATITSIAIKSGLLFVEMTMESYDKAKKEKYCKAIVTVGIRKGGY